ncbi:ABC transporter permease [Phyllobacterium sp. 21LDTY02-6]|uniref:ABC transporter permease n=1 Tax=unclassified Phyllobacterium TaxID=2638441 RepID=UPI0020207296|nr:MULTISPECIES: ABC transporter permease [unclassified Phyllobacterium]MCO4318249.1 ABC transporter permease [Phyllobacterium sp. 21LDTY02-6]MCX8280244.1 ABC transporter permease [Phyllobacterium sp. 0TCS1.6C]MCX8294195.1 ABC transporter permease [Phyllobacterium sp. 0TCS1.6A]
MNPALLRKLLLLAPLLLFLGLAYVVPFLGVVRWSFTLPEPGIGQYKALLTDPLVHSVFIRTLRICLAVTVLSLAAAYAIAYVWVRGSRVQRMLAEFCILVPFWISVLTRAFGWLAMLSNRGLINSWLQSAGIISEPLALARNELGVIIGMTHFLIPFAVFPIASAMRNVDERILLAARGMGSSRTRTFWTIFVPLTSGGIIGAALIVFVFALGFFVTPAILGGGRSVMVAELVYLRIFQSPDWGLGAAISVALVLVIGILLALLRRFIKPAHLVG